MKILPAFLLFTGVCISTFAQKLPPADQQTPAQAERVRQEQDRRVEQSFKNLERLENVRTPVRISLTRRTPLSSSFAPEFTKEQAARLRPDAADSTKFADFLKAPKTGLIKLFPNLGCESNYVISADEKCLDLISGSSTFSFRKRNYSLEKLSDIRLKGDVFISDGIVSQGIIVVLGDLPLENVLLDSDGLKFLSAYTPTVKNREELNDSTEFSTPVRDSGYSYSKTAPLIENTTYAVRTIAYRGNVWIYSASSFYNLLEADKRVDTIVAFRVIRQDKNGAVTLLWKELSTKDSPKLKYKEKQRRNDFENELLKTGSAESARKN